MQPGRSLYGLQAGNPVDPDAACKRPSARFATANDPAVGQNISGVNVFRGLALYAAGHEIVGGVGVSGDTSYAGHNIAWRVRQNLGPDHIAASDALLRA